MNFKSTGIKKVDAQQIYDSRGKPTVEARVTLDNGVVASAISPSGASVGSMEAVELRDKSKGLVEGVLGAVKNVEKIGKQLTGMDATNQAEVDEAMIMLDGTNNKSIIGANAILPVSLAVAKAASISQGLPLFRYLGGLNATVLPVPMMNFINGGVHADNSLDIQEFMIMPVNADSFGEAIAMSSSVLAVLRDILKKKGFSINVGDEGGFAIDIGSAEGALDLLITAIEGAGFFAGKDILISLDVAASELHNDGLYKLKGEGENAMNAERLSSYYNNLIQNYPIFSIEDPFSERDITGFTKFTESYGDKLQIVGDDVFATNSDLLQEGISRGVANAIIIKPNQIGTLTETLDTIRLARSHNYHAIISHRSGETEDISIAHIAVGFGIYQIKAGSLIRTDRVAKYNELLRIEKELGRMAVYAGSDIVRRYNEFRAMQ